MARRGTVTVPSGGLGAAEVGVWVLVAVAGDDVGSMEEVGVRMGGSASAAQASPVNPKNNSTITKDNRYM